MSLDPRINIIQLLKSPYSNFQFRHLHTIIDYVSISGQSLMSDIFELQITGPVLRALADENEFVRETAYKAGQRLVMMYADSAITLLLPGKAVSLGHLLWPCFRSHLLLSYVANGLPTLTSVVG